LSDPAPAIEVVLQHEGTLKNYWVNNPKDPGGETAWGISTLIINREGITNEELELPPGRPVGWLKALKRDVAGKIYCRVFWEPNRYEQIDDQTVATKLFDAGVNMGPTRALLLLQQRCGPLWAMSSPETPVFPDGIMGPKTLAMINGFEPTKLDALFSDELATYYCRLVVKNEEKREFLDTWLKRAAWPEVDPRRAELVTEWLKRAPVPA
jgi:lysozyme family protein